MKVHLKHGKVTQNIHGASRNYRYVWDVSVIESPEPARSVESLTNDTSEETSDATSRPSDGSSAYVIRPKRIYNFCLLHVCFV